MVFKLFHRASVAGSYRKKLYRGCVSNHQFLLAPQSLSTFHTTHRCKAVLLCAGTCVQSRTKNTDVPGEQVSLKYMSLTHYTALFRIIRLLYDIPLPLAHRSNREGHLILLNFIILRAILRAPSCNWCLLVGRHCKTSFTHQRSIKCLLGTRSCARWKKIKQKAKWLLISLRWCHYYSKPLLYGWMSNRYQKWYRPLLFQCY